MICSLILGAHKISGTPCDFIFTSLGELQMPSVRLSLGRRGPIRRGLAWAGVYWRRTDVYGMVVYKNNLRCVAGTRYSMP
ncbi:unnamed protein product [Sphagnum jensenii]|uniref:Uncharacterized protein n=1 Tax=Sphagnum jensenii TaxID=128206 RepID=A0ABP0W5U4_9BRYO